MLIIETAALTTEIKINGLKEKSKIAQVLWIVTSISAFHLQRNEISHCDKMKGNTARKGYESQPARVDDKVCLK